MKKFKLFVLGISILSFNFPVVSKALENKPADPAYNQFSSIGEVDGKAVEAINNARKSEGLPNLQLPSDFYSLSDTEKIFTLINLERKDRGMQEIKVFDINMYEVTRGFVENIDKCGLSSGYVHNDPCTGKTQTQRMQNNLNLKDQLHYSAEVLAINVSPVGAMYEWVYNDGGAWNWAHRNTILSANLGSDSIISVYSMPTSQFFQYANIVAVNFGAPRSDYKKQDFGMYADIFEGGNPYLPSAISSHPVNIVYRAILGREVKESEFLESLSSSQEDLAQKLLEESEFETKMDQFIRETYFYHLNREVDATGLSFWKTRFPLEMFYGITNSDEYINIKGSGNFFDQSEFPKNNSPLNSEISNSPLNGVYRSILGREIVNQEYQDNQSKDFGQMIENLKNSSEYKIKSDKYVSEIYRHLLQRDPDNGGLDFWKSRAPLEVYFGITESEEYKNL